MPAPTTPCGTWPSPLAASLIASRSLTLGSLTVDGSSLYWLEGRPEEDGRSVLVRCGADLRLSDVTPREANVRTRVHEYGGGAYLVDRDEVFYVNFGDQRVYRQRGANHTEPLTANERVRYADFTIDRSRRRLICVREDHRHAGEPTTALVSLFADAPAGRGDGIVLASGHDFYSSPRVSPAGDTLAWLAWRHPNMPWDGTELWVGGVDGDGRVKQAWMVAGGDAESVCQPGWSADGSLVFVSDRDGWWRFYVIDARDFAQAEGGGGVRVRAMLPTPPPRTEFARPQWTFGTSLWTFVGPSTIVATFSRDGRLGLASIDVTAGTAVDIDTDLEPIDNVVWHEGCLAVVAGTPTRLSSVMRLSLDASHREVVRRSSSIELDPDDISHAEAITFPTGDGADAHAHAFYYPPRNRAHAVRDGERPPLVVICHGGPTDAARRSLRLTIQFWTTRGFAVVDVDHRGSTGYGRVYREQLKGRWGIVDVEDCARAALYLVSAGRADPARLIIRGGSAGGFTVLAALTFRAGVFQAGASYYGVCDLEVLARDTHKFESRYLDGLVGPYPEARETYRARSPIHAVDRLACPLILFHGAEDRVVPLNQARLMADALEARGLPVALLVFEGEQHGFRRAPAVVRSLEAELWFYGAVFGFTPADVIEPVEVRNLDRR